MKHTHIAYPMALPSVANLREHWAQKAKRTKHHRSVGLALARQWVHLTGARLLLDKARMRITLTRVAPRSLDSDNLASAFKGVRDGIAEGINLDDGDARLEWVYSQAKGAPEVRVAFEDIP